MENPTRATGPSRDFFATTRWTVVLAAGSRSTPIADVALEELCRTYWYPLYAYVRRHGHSREDAEDLTQSFSPAFCKKTISKNSRPSTANFAPFFWLRSNTFWPMNRARARRQKRGGGVALLSLDWQGADTRYQIEPADLLSPDKIYDRAWAVTLLERVITRLREENAADGKAAIFERLKPFLMVGRSDIPYAQTADGLALTEGAACVAVHRLRRRYRELLREEIGQTLSDPAQVEEEMRALFSAFAA